MSRENRQRLQFVLEVYGADPRAWPEADRRNLAGLHDAASELAREARQIDGVLSAATAPMGERASFDAILTAIAGANPKLDGVIPFRQRPSSRATVPLRWFAAVPIAASLALGIYVGSTGSLDSFLPTSLTGETLAAGEDPGDLSGISDIEAMTGDGVS